MNVTLTYTVTELSAQRHLKGCVCVCVCVDVCMLFEAKLRE